MGDGPAFHCAAIESRFEIQPWMPWCHDSFSVEEANRWVDRQVDAFREAREFEFIIVDAGGALIGGCGLNQIDTVNRRANVGYWVRTSASGRGHATAAVKFLTRWARDNTSLERLEIVAAIRNRPSIRVAEKLEANREGVLRNRLLLHEQFHDAVLFSLIRDENMAG